MSRDFSELLSLHHCQQASVLELVGHQTEKHDLAFFCCYFFVIVIIISITLCILLRRCSGFCLLLPLGGVSCPAQGSFDSPDLK